SLLVLLVACGGDGDDKDAAPSSTTTTTDAPSTTSSTTTTTEAPVVEEGKPATVALEWVTAIADGDDARAQELVSPRSMAAIGGVESWPEYEIPLAEGWGAWGHGGVEVITADITDGVWAVTFHGEISQEGPPAESWSTLLVVATEAGLRVEPFLDLGTVEPGPESGAAIEPTHEFSAFVPGGREVALLVDGELVDTTVESADGDMQRAFAEHTLDPGLHGFAIVVWNESGAMARSVVYTVPND
ncbi:MAG TPA: hypothetical protein VEA78_12425, partial [Acidimicrobiales bacterium]|nr:hypothetical protein [Acidimicrobiales bacterium]